MTKQLLIAMALVEMGAGIALVVVPSFFVELLLGDGLSSPQSLVLGRIAGAALFSISIACWRASATRSADVRGLIGSILIYNLAVPIFLSHAAIANGMRGIAIWPACAIHTALAIWCAICLRRG